MVYYLLLPFFSVILIVLQTTFADVLFSGRLVLEISVIAVIYAGFRFNLAKGALSAFILGFVFDCLAGSVLGLFTFVYVLVFLFSFFASERLIAEKMHFIALFTLLCVFLEEFIAILFYNLIYGFELLSDDPGILLAQAIMVSLLAPLFFSAMRRIEVFLYGKPAKSAERSGTGRIPAET
ncbi:MAG TPA: rod shape-determining protein MreD [Smithellaceae bacterium]|nr:rod shape-determining protein MreD [Smithellaceae bacterium]